MRTLLVKNTGKIEVKLAPEVVREKENVLEFSSTINSVTDDLSHEQAVNALQQISGLLKEVERSRKEVKQPILEICKQIDTLAKKFTAELIDEKERIAGLSGPYEIAKRQTIEAANEQKRIELANLATQIKAATSRAEKVAIEQRMDSIAIDKSNTAGTKILTYWKIEVEDIHALYAFDRTLVHLEPKKLEIQIQLEAGITIPGIKATKENKLTI